MYKILEEGKTVDKEGEGKERIITEKVVLPTGGGEATKTENTEALYSSVR